MSIDKTWMKIFDRTLPQYEKGVNEFLDFAFGHDEGRSVRCPCKKCNNNLFRTRNSIYEHLMLNGINRTYKQWYHNGEVLQYYSDNDDVVDHSDKNDNDDGMRDMLCDLKCANANYVDQFDAQITNDVSVEDGSHAPNEVDDFVEGNSTDQNIEAAKFYRLLRELEQELYPGCEKSSTLSFIVEVLNWKCLYGISTNAVDGMLQTMKRWFPKGWSTKGKLACPTCNFETSSRRLKSGRKTCYLGHRRFLPSNHSWRKNAKAFDGTKENQSAPKQLSGDDIIEQYNQFSQVKFGKTSRKRKRGADLLLGNWRKKSIFFQLPYWRKLKLRHNLDVMHIEKNICDNIIGTLLNIEGKTKDTINTRFDLASMGIRPELHASSIDNGRYVFRPACYTLSKDEKRVFCQFLCDLKVPDGYSSNISRCVSLTECKVFGMKCHDCHVFLHRYLPLAIRGLLGKEVCEALIELCTYFRELCAKVLHFDDLERLENSISFTLCKLEKIFPPSFFDIMVHLTIHLVSEAKLAGPVQFRWMYPIERYLRTLKSYVRNKARPEGSIAEAYIMQECMHFCSRYLHESETMLNRVGRNYEGNAVQSYSGLQVFSQSGKPLLRKKYDELSLTEWAQARMYVLKNCEEVREFLNMHKEKLSNEDPRNIERRHEKEFHQWFKKHISQLHDEGTGIVNNQLLHLAYGPDRRVFRYKSFLINGWRFNTKDRDSQLKTQNSGLLVKGDEDTGNLDYFGVLTDIIQLNYNGGNSVILFKADWWDVYKKCGFKVDKFGFPMVNVTHKLNTDEPYVLASQAEQVYYVRDIKDPNWQVVVRTKPRDLYDFPEKDEPCQENKEFWIYT